MDKINVKPKTVLWKTVRIYECPDCGELVRDMNAACNHVCKVTRMEVALKAKVIKNECI